MGQFGGLILEMDKVRFYSSDVLPDNKPRRENQLYSNSHPSAQTLSNFNRVDLLKVIFLIERQARGHVRFKKSYVFAMVNTVGLINLMIEFRYSGKVGVVSEM